ncbi:secreted protein, putative [Ixodes scapularis]|uniref:Secreted protein, putative n=1 Tax=Ixodes scapularis TaxID=6945 RepID=B7QJN2_IXOSC|nr:secreted protein, putative [Ixodes scapularis]|eukprot:XP_002415389.1 secreted protein, putative [Ixodes scapularis]
MVDVTGLLTTAEGKCEPRYNGGYGGNRGANVIPGWTFNPRTRHCEQVMTRGSCRSSQNCFQSSDECESECGKRPLRCLNAWHTLVMYGTSN